MADYFDGEASGAMDNNPLFGENGPDLAAVVIKQEVINFYDSEFESTSSVQDRKPYIQEEIPNSFKSLSSDMNDNENLENELNCNKIILGSKPNFICEDVKQFEKSDKLYEDNDVSTNNIKLDPESTDEKFFEELVTCYEANVELHDIQSYLLTSKRFCNTCGILFPEPNVFERHVEKYHSGSERSFREVKVVLQRIDSNKLNKYNTVKWGSDKVHNDCASSSHKYDEEDSSNKPLKLQKDNETLENVGPTLYYCDTCNCFFDLNNGQSHKRKLCKNWSKLTCERCGLMFSKASMPIHRLLHDKKKDLTLSHFKFFDLSSGQPINPPIPEDVNIKRSVNNRAEIENTKQSANIDYEHTRQNLRYCYCETCNCCITKRKDIHLDARGMKLSCEHCGLLVPKLSMVKHMPLHKENKDLTLNNIEYSDLYSGQPIKPPVPESIHPMNSDADVENIEGPANNRDFMFLNLYNNRHMQPSLSKVVNLYHAIHTESKVENETQNVDNEGEILNKDQTLNFERWCTKRNLTYYFCETCKCFVTKYRKKAHLEARCKTISKGACKRCGLMFTTGSLKTHRQLHKEKEDLSLNNLNFFNLYTGQPINPTTPGFVNIKQRVNIGKRHGRRNLTYYYCETCKCYLTKFNNTKLHKRKLCKNMPKMTCNNCGLTFTRASMMTHGRLHQERKDLTLKMFKFFYLHNGKPMNPSERDFININKSVSDKPKVANTNRSANVDGWHTRRNLTYYYCETHPSTSEICNGNTETKVANVKRPVDIKAKVECVIQPANSKVEFGNDNLPGNIGGEAIRIIPPVNIEGEIETVKQLMNIENEVDSIITPVINEAEALNIKRLVNNKAEVVILKRNMDDKAALENIVEAVNNDDYLQVPTTGKADNSNIKPHFNRGFQWINEDKNKKLPVEHEPKSEPIIRSANNELLSNETGVQHINLSGQTKGWRTKLRLTLYYCETCKCFETELRKAAHIQECYMNLTKTPCKHCGLIWSTASYIQHKTLHEERKGLTLKNFELFDIYSGQPINPPIPEYPKCEHCAVHFLTITAKNSHVCREVSSLKCRICGIKLSEAAFKLHMTFHQYPTDNSNTTESNDLQPVLNLDLNIEKGLTEKKVKNENRETLVTSQDMTEVPKQSSLDTYSIVYTCRNCSVSVDTYDKVVEHSQRHYETEEHVTKTLNCTYCDINMDEADYLEHQNLHAKAIEFKFLHFDSYYLPVENDLWVKHIFETLPHEKVVSILTKSIYRVECRIKMHIVQFGDPNFTVYRCDRCSCFIEPSSLFKHADFACFKLRNHPCTVCGIPFNSSTSRIVHEQIHKYPGLTSESYKIVVFNRASDLQINRSFCMRKKYVLFICRNCDVIIDKDRTDIHTCDLTNIKNCPDCALLLNMEDYETHMNTHKLFISFNYSNMKVIILGGVKSLEVRADNNLGSKFKGAIYDYKIFVCSKCQICIRNQESLPKHVCRFGKQRLKCSKCGFYFTVARLRTHTKCHEQDPDFIRPYMYVVLFDPWTLDQNKNTTNLYSKDKDREPSDSNT